jgi:hypothetical protein
MTAKTVDAVGAAPERFDAYAPTAARTAIKIQPGNQLDWVLSIRLSCMIARSFLQTLVPRRWHFAIHARYPAPCLGDAWAVLDKD